MANDFAARCGIYCGDCKFREQMKCPGCVKAAGLMFWGECRVAICCNSRSLEHCGLCPEVPCDILNEFSYDATHGDNGARIERCKAWAKEGFDAWLAKHEKQA